jgi:hypothetical protein
MLRRQCGNQLRAERARETTKLIAIIDDDDTMQDSLRDLMDAAGNKFRCDPRQRMKLDCYHPGPLDFAGFRPLTRCVLCVKLLNRSHGGPRTT